MNIPIRVINMNDKDTIGLLKRLLEIRDRDLERKHGQYKALETLNTRLIEAARYATCPECQHNRCQGLRDALKAIEQAEGN